MCGFTSLKQYMDRYPLTQSFKEDLKAGVELRVGASGEFIMGREFYSRMAERKKNRDT